MAFQRKVAPAQAANVARMMTVGNEPTVAPAADLSYLDNVTESAPEGSIGSPVSEGNPDPAELHIDPDSIKSDHPAAPGNPEQAVVTASDNDPDGIDDPKLKGKNRRELAEIYKNLESEKGRLANEIGEYRQTFDKLVLQQARQQRVEPQPAAPVDESELLSQLLTNPSKVLSGIEARVVQQFRQQETQKLVNQIKAENNHLTSDPNFVPFLKTIPQAILAQVDHDPAQLMFIINQFKAISGIQPTTQAPPTVRDVKVGVAAGTGQSSKAPPRIWTRGEIRALAGNDTEYRKFLPEIEKAYAEGRVKS